MTHRIRSLLAAGGLAAAALAASLAPAAAQHESEQLHPLFTYRTGPYAPSGIPFLGGNRDYIRYVNEVEGGVDGVKIFVQECETAYTLERGIECYERYKAGVAGLRAGDPFDEETTLAPLSSQGAADEIREKVRQAVAYGATALEVGPPVPNHGAFVQPTILTNISEDNPARYWEFFGPVSMLFRAKDEEDAVRIANDSPYGLGGSVFTSDTEHGAEVARKISTGMVFVNHPTMVKADLPFGGIRRSGYGRELLDLGIKEFVNHKLINVVAIDAPFCR